ncbi:hypothetical protein NHX12_015079 [Muraenolepis orangiensis]|uniref:Uncharacterized protein n=1 Tax=Muraenolepis orangiensis TaxID=630683 RepID=A0A9Q0D984_9TELE|nr:hypothetical protein NHX12_015079 [Muraenolepis orangiensis]
MTLSNVSLGGYRPPSVAGPVSRSDELGFGSLWSTLRPNGYPGLQNQQFDREENENHDFVPGAWQEGRDLEDTQTASGPNTASQDGKKQRNLLKHWVNPPLLVQFIGKIG